MREVRAEGCLDTREPGKPYPALPRAKKTQRVPMGQDLPFVGPLTHATRARMCGQRRPARYRPRKVTLEP